MDRTPQTPLARVLKSAVSLFCLVHGSTQDASGWDLLVSELQRLGHEVARMTLPDNTPEAGATHYADVIAQSIPADCDDAIVVAHSASGLFLPLVAEKGPVRRLVFLAAVIPQIGKSFYDQINENKDMLNPDWIGKDPTTDEQLARQFLFHDCSPEVSKWALSTLRLMFAREAMLEVCPLRAWPDVPSSYILCLEDRTVRPDWCRRAARERLNVQAIELPGGHCPHVSRPRELAPALSTLR
jgi:pimeloyl-ACP methyl ester carboxylesterase